MRSDSRHVRLRRLASHPWLRWGLGGAAVLAGAISVGAALAPGRDAERREGPRLQIALATPPEPVIEPGEVMDVGELRNDFDRRVLARAEAERQAQADVQDAYFIDAMDEEEAAAPPPDDVPRVTVAASLPPPSPPTPRPAPLGRPERFGFDVPRPDYAAERRARMIEREARMAERERRRDRLYFSSAGDSHQTTTGYIASY